MNSAVRRRLLQALTLGAVCLTAFFATPLRAQNAEQLAVPAGITDLGPAPAEQPATATVYLRATPERQAALVQLLNDLTTPASASYHHWLTPAAFQAQFGPDAQAYASVTAFARANGLTVAEAAGFRVRLTGPVRAVEAAFATRLDQATVNGKAALVAMQAPSLPEALRSAAITLGRQETAPERSPLSFAADGAALPASPAGSLADFAAAVESNTARVLTVGGSACASSFTDAERTTFQLYLRQAAAQGITVLAASGCADANSSSFPGSFPELTAIASPEGAAGVADPAQPRPAWQNAPGLPADGLRATPDAAVASMAVLARTFDTLLASAAPNPDGTPARLGNVAGTLYQLASIPGLYTQPDGRSGTWESGTGLGVIDPKILGQVFPMGSLGTSVSVTVSNPGATHGQNITFSSTVKDVSGQGNGVVPTGTVTWNFNNGISLGPVTLVNGTASITTNQLPGAYGYTVTAQYSGNGTYSAASANTGFTVLPEPAGVSAVVNGSTPLGGNISVAVTITSKSGVGTPTGSASVAPQGTADKNTYTAPLTSASGTGTATVTLPAVQGGNVTLLVNCVSTSNDFSCYVPVQSTATVTTGKSATAIALSTSGNQTTLTATVTGAGNGFPTPTGNMTFTDNGTNVGSATLNSNAQASVTFTTPSGSGHSYIATYGGDNNYAGSASTPAATGTSSTTTLLTISPNPPVAGNTTTLTASIAYTAQGAAVPGGTVSFYEDNALVGSAQVVNGTTATISGTNYSGASAHSFYAVYSGDNVYAPSTSATVNTPTNGALVTGTALTVTPNPPVSGATTTLTATISYSAMPSYTPTGTMSFYMDGLLFGTTAIPSGSKTATLTSSAISSTSAHSFYAVYSGDANFVGSSSSTVVTSASGTSTTTTAFALNPNPPVSGATTTLTATIGYTPSGSAIPTGTVSFYQDSTLLGSGTVSGGTTASMSSSTLSNAAAHTYYAAYNGDSNYASSRSSAISTKAQTGNGVTTTTITSSASTVAAGGSVTFTATVAPTTSGATTPTGTVTFTSSTQGALGTGTLNASGVATLTVALSTAGTQSVTAAYSGDSNYAVSSSTTPASVNVTGTVTPAITLTVSPSTAVYGANVALTSNVTVSVTSGTTPTGSVTWTLTPNNGGTPITYTGTLNATSATTATASATIAAPAVGTYTVTATCSGTNISCTGLTASAGLAVTKVSTTTTITASPSTPVAGQPEILTATITPATGNGAVCAGSVSFYIGGSYAGNGSVSGNQATFITTLPSTTNNVIYAIYTGDGNCSPSTSNALTLTTPPAATTGTNSASSSSVLYSSSVTFTVVVTSTATASNPYPGAPTGAVNFYDTFNGLQTLIGSATLVQSGAQSSIATFSTTGLQAGTHSVDALFAGSTKYSPVDAGVAVVAVTDFSTAFSPPTATVTKGQTATVLLTLAPINGFSGQIALNCTPPASTQTTCVISPSIVTGGGGIATMTIGTTAPQGSAHPVSGSLGFLGALAVFLWPSRRRWRPVLAVLLLAAGLSTLSGCTTVQSEVSTGGGGSGSGGNSSGTPSGTQLFTIVASGTDGRTTNRHTLQYQVTVQ